MDVPNIKIDDWRGMNQDTAAEKLQPGFYLDALNMRTPSPQSGQKGRIETFNGYNLQSYFNNAVWLSSSEYAFLGGCHDEDIDGFYLFYQCLSSESGDLEHVILRYNGRTNAGLELVLKSSALPLGNGFAIDNHGAVLNNNLAWTDGTGNPYMFNAEDAINNRGPFYVEDKNTIPTAVFELPYYTPLQEPYNDRYYADLAGDLETGFGTIDSYKNVTIEDGHQFCFQLVHYNGMASCLSAPSQIYFLDDFYISIQLDDVRQLYLIDIPDTLAGDEDIRFNGVLDDVTLNRIGMVTSIRYFARLTNKGDWYLINEVTLPATIPGEIVTKIANFENNTVSGFGLGYYINQRDLLKGPTLAADDQNYIFSNIPYAVKDVVFANSRLFLGGFTDGYDFPTAAVTSFNLDNTSTLTEVVHEWDTPDDELKVHQIFKTGTNREFGLVFYDKYRKRSTVGSTTKLYIEPIMMESNGSSNYNDPPIGYDKYKFFMAQQGTFNEKDVPSDYTWWLNDSVGYFRQLSQVFAIDFNELPDWVAYAQVVVRQNMEYEACIQTIAQPYYWYNDDENVLTLTGALSPARLYVENIGLVSTSTMREFDEGLQQGIAFLINSEEPYVYEKGDIVRGVMPNGILDGGNEYDPTTNEFSLISQYYVDFKVKEVRGNLIICTYPDDVNELMLGNIFNSYVNNNGKTTVSYVPWYSEFRKLFIPDNPLFPFVGSYDEYLGRINSYMSELRNFFTPDLSSWTNFDAGESELVTQNSQYIKIEILRPQKQSTDLWNECGPCVNVRKYGDADGSSWVPYLSQVWGDTYLRSYKYKFGKGKSTQKICQIGYATGAPWDRQFDNKTLKGLYLRVHLESTKPTNKFGLNFENAGFGQSNVLTGIPQQVRYETGVTFSGILRLGGQFNELNRFAFDSIREFPKDNGPITKLVNVTNLQSTGIGLLVIGELLTESVRLQEVQFKDTGSGQVVALSDRVLGSSQTLAGQYGCQDALSVVSQRGWCFFYDRLRAELVRYGYNGLTPLGQTYGMRKYFLGLQDLIVGAQAYGGYDNQRDEYLLGFTLQNEGTRDFNNIITYRNVDTREGFVSFLESYTSNKVIIGGAPNQVTAGVSFFSTQYHCFRLDLYYGATGESEPSLLPQVTGLLDIQNWKNIAPNEPYIASSLPSYITPIFTTRNKKMRWQGLNMQLNTANGLGTISGISALIQPYDVMVTALDEYVVLGDVSSELKSKIYPDDWKYREGRIAAPIRPAIFDVDGANIGAGENGSYDTPATNRNVLIQSTSMTPKITLIPDRSEQVTDDDVVDYYQRFLIFVQAILSVEQPQP